MTLAIPLHWCIPQRQRHVTWPFLKMKTLLPNKTPYISEKGVGVTVKSGSSTKALCIYASNVYCACRISINVSFLCVLCGCSRNLKHCADSFYTVGMDLKTFTVSATLIRTQYRAPLPYFSPSCERFSELSKPFRRP